MRSTAGRARPGVLQAAGGGPAAPGRGDRRARAGVDVAGRGHAGALRTGGGAGRREVAGGELLGPQLDTWPGAADGDPRVEGHLAGARGRRLAADGGPGGRDRRSLADACRGVVPGVRGARGREPRRGAGRGVSSRVRGGECGRAGGPRAALDRGRRSQRIHALARPRVRRARAGRGCAGGDPAAASTGRPGRAARGACARVVAGASSGRCARSGWP